MKKGQRIGYSLEWLINVFIKTLTLSSFSFFIFLISPFYSIADENDFKSDASNAFTNVEKKVVFNKYEGELTKNKSDLVYDKEQFPGQKIYIRPAGEWTSEITYNGSPLKGKYLPVDGLVFSPDHKVALTYGAFRKKSGINFIDTDGKIYKEVDFSNCSIEDVKPINQEFVVLCQRSGPVSLPGWQLRLSRFDYSGNEIWRKDFNDGVISWHAQNLLSVSPNGGLIILACQKKNGKPKEGFTYILDGEGNVLNKFNVEYQSVLSSDNEIAVLINQKNLRMINVKNKTILLSQDLDENSKYWFGMGKSYQNGKPIVLHGDGRNLDEILVFDLKNKKVIRWDTGHKDYGFSDFIYSGPENKIVRIDHNHIGYKTYESFDAEK